MTDMRGKACLFSLAGTSPLFFLRRARRQVQKKVGNNFMHHLKTVHVPVQGTFLADMPTEEKVVYPPK
jgi:hypothetical protein